MVSPLYLTCSLSFNDICYEGKMGGLTALCKMLKSNSTLLELECAHTLALFGIRQRPMTVLPFTLLLARSLNNNQLCGLDHDGDGNYTAEGITKITKMLSVNTTLKSIRYAAFRKRQRPLTVLA